MSPRDDDVSEDDVPLDMDSKESPKFFKPCNPIPFTTLLLFPRDWNSICTMFSFPRKGLNLSGGSGTSGGEGEEKFDIVLRSVFQACMP